MRVSSNGNTCRTTDLEKRFLKNTDDTGRFIYQSLVTGRKYYVEPIGGHSDWGRYQSRY